MGYRGLTHQNGLHTFGDFDAEDKHEVLDGNRDGIAEADKEKHAFLVALTKDWGVLVKTVEALGEVVGVVGHHGGAIGSGGLVDDRWHLVKHLDDFALLGL